MTDSVDPRKVIQGASPITEAEPLKPKAATGTPKASTVAPKPRVFKHEARSGDLRLTYSISQSHMNADPQLLNLLIDNLSHILMFACYSESTAIHLLADLRRTLDELMVMFAPPQEEVKPCEGGVDGP